MRPPPYLPYIKGTIAARGGGLPSFFLRPAGEGAGRMRRNVFDVGAMAAALARRMGLPEEAAAEVARVALLRDVGKVVGVDDEILGKPGPLEEAEWELLRRSPVVGERIVASAQGLAHLAPAVRSVHERWDGRGYPDGLSGEDIPVASRIAFVCGAFEAMTSDRPYREALGADAALRELERNAGSQFCPRAVAALVGR